MTEKTQIWKEGDCWWAKGAAGSMVCYSGEDAKVLDLVFGKTEHTPAIKDAMKGENACPHNRIDHNGECLDCDELV